MPNKNPLFAEFPPIDPAEWLAKIEKDLKGKALETLYWEPAPGLKVPPLFHPTDSPQSSSLADPRAANAWEIGQLIQVTDLKETNQRVLTSLQGGAKALEFELDAPLSKVQLDLLLKDVIPAYISLHFSWKNEDFPVFQFWDNLHAYMVEQGMENGNWSGSIHWTPKLEQNSLEQVAQLIRGTDPANVQLLHIKAQQDESLDMAAALAVQILEGQAYIARLQALGISAKESSPCIQFALSTSNTFFVEIARIRALKMLWANVLKAYDLDGSEMHITAYTAAPTTDDDPYRFMIQSATQAMSAVMGGANRLFVTAANHGQATSDSRFTDNPNFGPRIARNVQHLLQLESFMDRVIDPGAGSYYIEHLTQELAHKAWQRFQAQAL